MKQLIRTLLSLSPRHAGLALVGFALLLSACAGGSQPSESTVSDEMRPGWVINPPQTSDTVYGVGGAPVREDIADSVQQARQAATANMVTNLRVQIMAETRASVSASDEAMTNQFSQDISSVIPDIQLDETRLEETWEDPNGFVYTLVSLDRRAAAERVRHRFELDRSALSLPPESAEPNWQNYVAWQRSLRDVAALEARNDLHEILAGRPVSDSWPQQRADSLVHYETFVTQIAMTLHTPGRLSQQHSDMIREAFRDSGIGISESADGSWVLTVSLSEDTQQQGGMHYHFITANATLADESGVSRWQGVSTQRGVAGSAERARQQGVRSALSALSREFEAQFE